MVTITWVLACLVTFAALGMSAVSAWDRGNTEVDRALLVAVSVAICACTHLIPAALSRIKVSWVVWACCLAGTIFGHVSFLVNADVHKGVDRAQTSVKAVGVQKQLDAIHEALASMTKRSVTSVAEELSITQQRKRRHALQLELAEAQHAAKLRDDLVRLSDTASEAAVTAAENPVTVLVARVMGRSPASIELVIWLGYSVLMELVGALLWWKLLGQPMAVHGGGNPPVMGDPVEELKEAIAAGKCRPTVTGIREFMGCSQERAMNLRRQLMEEGSK